MKTGKKKVLQIPTHLGWKPALPATSSFPITGNWVESVDLKASVLDFLNLFLKWSSDSTHIRLPSQIWPIFWYNCWVTLLNWTKNLPTYLSYCLSDDCISHLKLRATKQCVLFAIVTSSSLAVEHFQWKDYPYFPVLSYWKIKRKLRREVCQILRIQPFER